ncbi:hypothetical protein [Paracidovorax wautersii]|uniref:Uncharacterized protein n=1 Tax=Paracidovorax wautersii TaxID=1177982 RepID=A0ABU1IHB4_9BURK|nr:hypothetical protein [Paracidovorax wautersii]MDR6216212.1 hypothetical protein [Paracidovorax wautersii]
MERADEKKPTEVGGLVADSAAIAEQITPEMTWAGAACLVDVIDHDREGLAEEIYTAMEKARRKGLRPDEMSQAPSEPAASSSTP